VKMHDYKQWVEGVIRFDSDFGMMRESDYKTTLAIRFRDSELSSHHDEKAPSTPG